MFVALKTLLAIEILLVLGLGLYRVALAASYKDVVNARAVGLLLLTPAIALFAGNVFLFFAYLTAAVAFTARTRGELCANYVMLLPAMPILGLYTAAGDVFLLPLSAVIALNAGALIGMLRTPRPPGGAIRAPYDWAFLLLLVMFVFIDGRNVSATSILRSIISTGLWIGAPYLLISRGLSRVEDLDRVLLRLGMAAVTGAVIAAFETARHWVLYQAFYDRLGVPLPMLSATLNLRGGWLRTGGPIIDYTAAGIFQAAVLVTMPYLMTRFRPMWRWIVVVTLVVGLAATQSRGAWLAAIAGILFVFAYRGAWAKVAIALGGGVIVQAAAFAAAAGSARFAETIGAGGHSAATADYRKELFWHGLDQVRAHPLFGQPPRQLTQNMIDMQQGQHIVDFVNTHLYVAMVAGLPFFCGWLAVWIVPAARAWRLRGTARERDTTAELPAAIMVTVLIALVATSLIDRNLLWLMVALGLTGPCFAFAGRTAPARTMRSRAKLVVGMPLPAKLSDNLS